METEIRCFFLFNQWSVRLCEAQPAETTSPSPPWGSPGSCALPPWHRALPPELTGSREVEPLLVWSVSGTVPGNRRFQLNHHHYHFTTLPFTSHMHSPIDGTFFLAPSTGSHQLFMNLFVSSCTRSAFLKHSSPLHSPPFWSPECPALPGALLAPETTQWGRERRQEQTFVFFPNNKMELQSYLQQFLVGCCHGEILLLLCSWHCLDNFISNQTFSLGLLLKCPDCLLSSAEQTQWGGAVNWVGFFVIIENGRRAWTIVDKAGSPIKKSA